MLGFVRFILSYGAAIFISAIFLDSLRFKFTGHETPQHIFTTLRDWSGIELFYPAGPWIIGSAELTASILLVLIPLILRFIAGRSGAEAISQTLGAFLAIGVMSGAVFFHLFSPLGVETPTAWENGAPTEWSPALFYAACASWLCAALILVLRGREALGALGAGR